MRLDIQTDRLVIRDFLKDDWPSLHGLYMLPETVRYNPSGYPESELFTKHLVDTWLHQPFDTNRTAYTAAIINKYDQHFVGIISLDLADAKYARAEIWYKLLPADWGKGYATEAMRAMLAFGFRELKLHRIECGCSIHNIASYKVMEKVGMQREGVKRSVLPLADGWHDAYMYGILAEEFFNRTII
ncbi:GNAT family N-acetyltransferase [Chitinophaga sp. Cy-1792]|uniref:GNAT family N-acetyltransferase n=1 Tax=Chitinophaga sp. Cy-1792 TaxID=2608339 RepID=UPI00141DF442|nr:GNAT family protein [Chitinophaga sp. Cy-1792]NIG55011.1 GNAT family N-acetyltransferase [Chitinophaga sp. Cy-1792]